MKSNTETKPDLSFFFRSLDGGGAERITANLAQGFADRGYRVDLVLTSASGLYLQQISSSIQVIDLSLHRRNKPKSSSAFRNLWELIHYLKKNQPKVLITGTHFINEVGILAKIVSRNTKVCVIEHTTISAESRFVEQRSSRLVPWTTRLLYPFADYIVAVSKGVAKDLALTSGLSASRINVIYNPILLKNMNQNSQQVINHFWFQNRNIPIILGAGRFVAQKDFKTLIKAFYKVRSQLQARLVLIGGGIQKQYLQQLSQKLGLDQDILLLDFVNNSYSFMACANVFVLSSRWEGLPTVLVEALALGIPVVATDCPSGPSEILNGGEYGALVPVGDEEAMARAIGDVLQGKAKFPTVSEQWRKQFDLDTAINQYEHLFGLSKN